MPKHHERTFVRACSAAKLRHGTPHLVKLDDHELAVFRVGSDYYAIENACPHAGASLADGQQDGPRVTCTLHGWTFYLETGECENFSCAALSTYRCRRSGDDIYVDLCAMAKSPPG